MARQRSEPRLKAVIEKLMGVTDPKLGMPRALEKVSALHPPEEEKRRLFADFQAAWVEILTLYPRWVTGKPDAIALFRAIFRLDDIARRQLDSLTPIKDSGDDEVDFDYLVMPLDELWDDIAALLGTTKKRPERLIDALRQWHSPTAQKREAAHPGRVTMEATVRRWEAELGG